MKRKINYLFCLENEYDETLGFEISEIEALLPRILDNLIKDDNVFNNSCFSNLKFESLSFDILFVDDERIREINRDYRGKDRTTDVITFALFADDDFKPVLDGDINLGEILISIDTAKTQAVCSIKEEILTLICHGILHLFGFDHQTEEDYNFIVNVQKRVLEAVLPQDKG